MLSSGEWQCYRIQFWVIDLHRWIRERLIAEPSLRNLTWYVSSSNSRIPVRYVTLLRCLELLFTNIRYWLSYSRSGEYFFFFFTHRSRSVVAVANEERFSNYLTLIFFCFSLEDKQRGKRRGEKWEVSNNVKWKFQNFKSKFQNLN